jgi:short-subunit dehydrogenase
VKVETYSVDFAKVTTEAEYREAFKPMLEKDVSILVNNVGYFCPGN